LRDPDRFEAWLHRLTVNASLDAVRRRRRRPIEIALTASTPQTMRDPTGLVVDRDELDVGFQQLTPDLRAILVLHYYVGMSMPEVAQTLGIPLGTAQSRLNRALTRIRRAIGRPETPAVSVPREGQVA
jgi:RNA polymerase sigma-70 factor (ECF subfamily)